MENNTKILIGVGGVIAVIGVGDLVDSRDLQERREATIIYESGLNDPSTTSD